MVEYAPNQDVLMPPSGVVAPSLPETSGGESDAILKQIQNLNALLDSLNEQGRLMVGPQRTAIRGKEDVLLQQGRVLDQAQRDQGAANVQGQVAEWKPAAGMTPVKGVEGVYRTGEAKPPVNSPGQMSPVERLAAYKQPPRMQDIQAIPGESESDYRKRLLAADEAYQSDQKYNTALRLRKAGGEAKLAGEGNLGEFSNVGVTPGRTEGDFAKERETAHQLDLVLAKARLEKAPIDAALEKKIEGNARERAKLQEGRIKLNQDFTMTPEKQKAAKDEVEREIAKLDAQDAAALSMIHRGKQTGTHAADYEPEIKPGWRSYRGEAKALGTPAPPPTGPAAGGMGAEGAGPALTTSPVDSKAYRDQSLKFMNDETTTPMMANTYITKLKQGISAGRISMTPEDLAVVENLYAMHTARPGEGKPGGKYSPEGRKTAAVERRSSTPPPVSANPVQALTSGEAANEPQPQPESPAQAFTASAQGGVKKAIGAIDQLPGVLFPRQPGGPSLGGPTMASASAEETPAAVDEAGRGIVSGIQNRVTPGIKMAQEQFNADIKGGLKVDDAILRVAKRFGVKVAEQIAARLDSSRANATPPPSVRMPIVPSYRGTIERMQ